MNDFILTNLAKRFGALQVLRNVSLMLPAGSITAVVGDNGAGKSTLLKILAGVHRPDEGSLHFGTDNLTQMRAAERRRAGVEMVYQDLALASQHDAAANLFMGRELKRFGWFLNRKEMRRRAERLLEELAIKIPRVTREVKFLSGGQQQAIAIARAVMFEPNVLLLDEPTAALAAREVERVLQILKEQRSRGRVILLVSHRLNDVFAVADRIVVLKHGAVFADYATASVTLSKVVEDIVS